MKASTIWRAGDASEGGYGSLDRVLRDLFGSRLEGLLVGGEAILRAEIDLGRIAEGKFDFDVVGHYARPDVFTLSVNEQPASPVIVEPGEASRSLGDTLAR